MNTNRIYLISTLFLIFLKGSATEQVSDLLIYENDTFLIDYYPLENLISSDPFEPDTITPKLFDSTHFCQITNCVRGYRATWEIIDNELYLIEIKSGCYFQNKTKSDLNNVFGKSSRNGKVKAYWCSNSFLARNINAIEIPTAIPRKYFFKNEYEFQIEKGVLKDFITYDNSDFKTSKYISDSNALSEYLMNSIDWSVIDTENKDLWIFFDVNENGVIDSVESVGDDDNSNLKEVERVLKEIPFFGVFYQKGKPTRMTISIWVILSEENKQKYK